MKSALAAVGALVVGLIVGVFLMVSDHLFIGIIVAALSIPVALIVWITVGEREF